MGDFADEFNVDVTAGSREALTLAVKLAMLVHSSIEGYEVRSFVRGPRPSPVSQGADTRPVRLHFFWHVPEIVNDRKSPFNNTTKIEETSSADEIVARIWTWLSGQTPDGPPPDTDGSYSRGFRLAAGDHPQGYDAFSVECVWLTHSK